MLHGVDIKVFRKANYISRRLRDWFNQGYFETGHSELESVTLMILMPSLSEAEEVVSYLQRRRSDILPRTVSIVVAALIDKRGPVPNIELVHEFVGDARSSLFSLSG